MGLGHGARTGVWHRPHNGPMGTENQGTQGWGRCRYVAKGNGSGDGMGREAESAQHQPLGFGKPVAMEW